MTYAEWALINALASQLQHFYDVDGKQAPRQEIAKLLDEAERCLGFWRPILLALDKGWQQNDNAKLQ